MNAGPLVEMLARNSTFAKSHPGAPTYEQMVPILKASRDGVLVLACSDPRVNPHQIFSVDQSMPVTLVRNAGGRAFDALRSLAVLQTVANARTIVVMHHTDCGLTHLSDRDVKNAALQFSPEAEQLIEATRFGEITGSVEDSIKEDLEILKSSPLIRKDTEIVGFIYDTFSGAVTEVKESAL